MKFNQLANKFRAEQDWDTALSQYQEVETSRRPCRDSTDTRRNRFLFNGLRSRFGYADRRVLIKVPVPSLSLMRRIH